MERTVRIGIIGAGFGEKVHAPALRMCAGCEVAGICAETPKESEEAALRLGIPGRYKSWREMIDDPAIDAVTIATPPGLRAGIALAAISKKKAVLCEKPLSLDVRSAERIARAAEKARVPNMMDLEFAEIGEWIKARDLLKSGSIGNLRRISVNWHLETYANKHRLSDNWKTSSEQGGGALYNFVSHVLYYLEWFHGPVKKLSAKLSKGPGDKRSADTCADLALSFDKGLHGSISVSTDSFLGGGHRVEFFGDNGTILLENTSPDHIKGFRLFLGTRSSQKLELIACDRDLPGFPGDGRVIAVSRLSERFVKWIRTGERQKPDLRDGLRVQKLIEAAKRSSASGKWVSAA